MTSLAVAKDAEISLYELIGIVKICRRLEGKSCRLTIHSSKSQKDYHVICPFFCPARRGDVISGYCINHERLGLTFVREPVVEPPSTREAIQTAFLIALKKTSFSKRLSDRLYRFFEEQATRILDQTSNKDTNKDILGNEKSTIIRNRDSLTAAVMETISAMALRFRTDEETVRPLMEVGLTKEQAEKLLRWWYRAFSLRRLYLLGLTRTEIRESCERGWSPDTLYYQLLENPYILERIPIDKARSIAQRYRLSFNQDVLEAADLVRFVDEATLNRGWACYPIYALKRKYPRVFELQSCLKTTYGCAIRYNFLYLKHHASTEDTLTQFLQSKPLPETHCSEITRDRLCLSDASKTRNQEQVDAVELALNNTVSVITGSAGTGKTTVISAITDELELRNLGYLVASFTGKAVALIKERIRRKERVMTLHMIINRGLPEDIDYLIIDEVSMVPNELLARVLIRIDNKTRNWDMHATTFKIVLVGDSHQVQPIEWGNLFNQILEAKTLPTIQLKEDHRRKDEGVLYANTNRFANTPMNEFRFEWGSDCQFIEGGIPEIEALARSIHQEGVSHEDITIISPYNRNLDDINCRLQRIFLPDDNVIIEDSFGKTWKHGSRVMMTVNRYDINVMNGEEGIITEIPEVKPVIKVRFRNGEEVEIPTFVPVIVNENDYYDMTSEEPLSTKLLVLSWAITIHKSQGSEWEEVIYWPQTERGYSSFMNRRLLYTGISRPKKNLYVVSDTKSNFEGPLYVEAPSRYDNLAKRLKNEEFVDHYVNPNPSIL